MTMRPIRRNDVQDYIGLSTDTKPTLGVMPGATFSETDTRKVYTWTGDITGGSSSDWIEGLAPIGASGAAAVIASGPRTLRACGTPVGIAPSGTMAANGAVTLGTALSAIYSFGLWLYFPSGAVYAGSAAGLYWCVMSSTTVGTVYNNIHIPGTNSPDPPTSPTAVVAAGPGAYTGATSEITVWSYTMPRGTWTPPKNLIVDTWGFFPNNANAKTVRIRFGATEFYRYAPTTTATFHVRSRWPMVAQNSLPVLWANGFGEVSTTTVVNTYVSAAFDVSDIVLTYTLQLAVDTDFLIVVLPVIQLGGV